MLLVPGLALLAACGRIGFDPLHGPDDGGTTVDVLSCVAVTTSQWAGAPMPNDVGSGLPNIATLVPSSDGLVVADQVTGLVWQRGSGPNLVASTDASTYCSTLALDGCSTWRVPVLIELESIVDHAEANAKIDATAFPQTPTDQVWWAATPEDANNTWVVNFANGNVFDVPNTTPSYVRCVESGSSGLAPPARYQVSTDTVLDIQTGLTWQLVADAGTYDQADAMTYCSTLALDGGGWRVPAIGELESIVNVEKSPTIDPTAFPGAPSSAFWTSSPLKPGDAIDGMILHFNDGTVINDDVTDLNSVRCVR